MSSDRSGNDLTDEDLKAMINDPSKIPEGQLKTKLNALSGIFFLLGVQSALTASTQSFESTEEQAAASRLSANVGNYMKPLFGLDNKNVVFTKALNTKEGQEQKAAVADLMVKLYRAADA